MSRDFSTASCERDIQAVIFEYLKKKHPYVVRSNQQYRKGRPVYKETIGQPDLWGIRKDGRPFYIEVKKPGGTLTIKQHEMLEILTRLGHEAFIATSLEDLKGRGL